MGSSRWPLKLHRLAAAVVGHGEALLVGTINMTVTKIQHFIITWERETGTVEQNLAQEKRVTKTRQDLQPLSH